MTIILIYNALLEKIVKSALQMHAEFEKELETIRIAQQGIANAGNIVIIQRMPFNPEITR